MFGIGCTMRECSDDVRFGITRSSSAARLVGRDSPERGREVKEGAIVVQVIAVLCGTAVIIHAFAVGSC